VITPGNPVAVDYGMQNDELTPEEKGSLVSEAIVLVASVPCQILVGEKSEERHQTLVMGSYKQEWAVSRGGGRDHESGRKRLRVTFNVGWVIVRLGYLEGPTMRTTGEGGNRVIRCVWQKVGETKGATNPGAIAKVDAGKPRETPYADREGCDQGKVLVKEANQIIWREVGQEKNRQVPRPRWCPAGLSKTQKRWLQKLRKKETDEEREAKARDEWFNKARLVVTPKKTWWEKRLAWEEHCSSEDTCSEGDNVQVNMVFALPLEFWALEKEVAELALGPKMAAFKKPNRLGQHMEPLFVKGYLEGRLV
jgi:hypothetical protein